MNTDNDNIMWDCSELREETPEVKKDPITREQALRNLPTNEEGENFAWELFEDLKRLNAIRKGEDAGISEQIANNPWLTKELIVSYLEGSEKTLLDAGFVL